MWHESHATHTHTHTQREREREKERERVNQKKYKENAHETQVNADTHMLKSNPIGFHKKIKTRSHNTYAKDL